MTTAVGRSSRPLVLVTEAKVAALLDGPDGRKLEASGVCVHDGAYYVIFDDLPGIARISDLSGHSAGNQLLESGSDVKQRGFEDITYDPLNDHFYVLVEAIDQGGVLMAAVHEYDVGGRHLSRALLHFALEASNKGLEGLSCIQRDGETFLLGLCEGNRCRAGVAGRTPGGGRIHVFAQRQGRWRAVAKIKLPKGVDFVDYASVAVSGDRIAVLSQSSAAVWIGTMTAAGFGIVDGGTIYEFPRDAAGTVIYCNVEGVSWAGGHLVMVSDKADPDAAPCREKDQSIHLFDVPAVDREPVSATAEAAAVRAPAVLGLFQRRIHGDDALLQLARLRFSQAGLGAEVYAHDEDDLRRILPFAPPTDQLPMVHLDRKLDLTRDTDRDVVIGFAEHFTGQVSGLVVHDQRDMNAHTDDLVVLLGQLDQHLSKAPGRPYVFLEYAAGHPVDWFAELGTRLRGLELVSLGLDIGHIGIRQARRTFERVHPAIELTSLSAADPRLPDLVTDVDEAVASALPAVLELVEVLGGTGRPLHFHLHDGHPLVAGLQDHRSFLTRLPIPFEYDSRYSLRPLYGPSGLAAVVTTAARACAGGGPLTFTLEIHESDGRLPVHDVDLFGHWRDMTNAERMNHWLGILADNATLVTAALDTAAR